MHCDLAELAPSSWEFLRDALNFSASCVTSSANRWGLVPPFLVCASLFRFLALWGLGLSSTSLMLAAGCFIDLLLY